MVEIAKEGGCLCGSVRFSVSREPDWVTICCCRFCQTLSGGRHTVQAIYNDYPLVVKDGNRGTYLHRSRGSGEYVKVHFCRDCGTRTHLEFDRWPDRVAVFSGAFDDPSWFTVSEDTTKFIFLADAQQGTIIPPGYRTYRGHSHSAEDRPLDATVFDHYHVV